MGTTAVLTLTHLSSLSTGIQRVRIDGATGDHSLYINGEYWPTGTEQSVSSHMPDAVRVTQYVKVGLDMLLEFNSATMSWQLKSIAGRGTNSCTAYCTVASFRSPQDCPPGQWQVRNGTDWEIQPNVSVKVEAGFESQQQQPSLSSTSVLTTPIQGR